MALKEQAKNMHRFGIGVGEEGRKGPDDFLAGLVGDLFSAWTRQATFECKV